MTDIKAIFDSDPRIESVREYPDGFVANAYRWPAPGTAIEVRCQHCCYQQREEGQIMESRQMSWAPEVQVKGEGDRWHQNALRFATKEEAAARAKDLYSRWTLATAHRAVESEDPVNYAYVNGELIHIETKETDNA